MNLLHVGDISGTASITSNMCNNLGHKSMVVDWEDYDVYGHGRYYSNLKTFKYTKNIIDYVKSNKSKIDHIIYHDRYVLARELDSLHIPSSYMFHSNIERQDPTLDLNICNFESIDNLFVCSEEMLNSIPNSELFYFPVDMNLFRPLSIKNKKDVALCITPPRYKYRIYEFIRNDKNNNFGIFTVDKLTNTIQYEKMPKLLNSFIRYIDMRYTDEFNPSTVNHISSIGLQALACGIPVLSHNGWNTVLPKANYDENSTKEFLRIISE